jgi:hypothetical protein
MPLPAVYRTLPEGAVASYNVTDLVSGQIFQKFYLSSSVENSTISFFTTTSTAGGHYIKYPFDIPASTAAFTLLGDVDFDSSTLTVPRILKGTAITNYYVYLSKVAGFVCQVYTITKLRRVRAGAETEIANIQSVTNDFGASSLRILCSQMTVPVTKLAIGDKIRITIEVWGKNTDGGNAGTFYIGVDPLSRTDATLTLGTASAFYCPFKIDL